ncbi:di-heme-cytochrome C peroxidase [soil metagenome]
MKSISRVVLWSVVVSGFGVGCVADPVEEQTVDAADVSAKKSTVFLDQGWSATTRASFYQTTQGSRMLPYAWFLHLEQATNCEPFREAENMRRMGFLVDGASSENPDGLPVGFAKDDDAVKGASLGLTCATCHTGEIKYRGTKIRIDGGQAFADLEQLQDGLLASLSATLADAAKFDRFAKRVLGNGASAAQKADLRTKMVPVRDWWSARVTRSRGLTPHGPSRIDAFTVIGNEVTCALLNIPGNCAPAVAPTQYPYLWGTPDYDWVQYNSSVHSPIGRNVGEVTGVFAEATLSPQGTVVSSANLPNLERLENWLKTLQPPAWPEDLLGAIDHTLADRGEAIYETSCASCHPSVAPRTAPNAFGMTFGMTDHSTPLLPFGGAGTLGTDPTAAMTFATRRSDPGPWRPIFAAMVPSPIGPDGKVPAFALLSVSGSMILKTFFAVNAFTPAQQIAFLGYREGLTPTQAQLTTYKARPLDGIAFTAPYLHNGSVPSLYEMLLPPAQRTKQFYVGSRTFDPKHIGFSTDKEPESVLLDTTQLGNSNSGHTYGTDLTKADRMALLEYLKSI